MASAYDGGGCEIIRGSVRCTRSQARSGALVSSVARGRRVAILAAFTAFSLPHGWTSSTSGSLIARLRQSSKPCLRRLRASPIDLEIAASCTLPQWDEDELSDKQKPGVPQTRYEVLLDFVSIVIFYILPFAGPSIAFLLWRPCLWLVNALLGSERQLLELTQVTLTPATNGIVVACLAIALGTLTSVTVSSLRSRQKEVRQCLNKEACELAVLQAGLRAALYPPKPLDKNLNDTACYLQVLILLRAYVARVYAESASSADASLLQEQSVSDTELVAILNELRVCKGIPSFTVYPVRDEATLRITRLNDARCDRLAAIATGFPFFHWMILALLACSVAVCFLVEVDQSEGRFLAERPEDSVRLRLVFTIMVGSFSGLTALCADLNDLFRGSFNVTGCTKQFKVMIGVLDQEIAQIREDTGCSE